MKIQQHSIRSIGSCGALLALSTMFLAQAAVAASPSKEEKVGAGTGAVIGAALGGPVGLMIGGAFGAKFGDTLYQKSEQIDDLQSELSGSSNEIIDLESNIVSLDNEIRELNEAARPELVAFMQAGINMDLLFRTDEFALTDSTGERLTRLAAMLADMSDVRIQLDGFADERGDADYNLALSERRVEFVRNLILQAGVNPSRIAIAAHGESPAQDDNIDSLALERRVSVTLFIDNASSLAANSE